MVNLKSYLTVVTHIQSKRSQNRIHYENRKLIKCLLILNFVHNPLKSVIDVRKMIVCTVYVPGLQWKHTLSNFLCRIIQFHRNYNVLGLYLQRSYHIKALYIPTLPVCLSFCEQSECIKGPNVSRRNLKL